MNLDKTYIDFIKQLKQKILIAKNRATLSVNRAMIELYFDIGREIVAKQESLGWGKSVVEQMAKDLQLEFGKRSGYSSANLWRMRIFYLTYRDNPNLAQLVREIPWLHNITIFQKCKEKDEQEYYIKTTKEICATLSHKLSWSHFVEFTKLKNELKRERIIQIINSTKNHNKREK